MERLTIFRFDGGDEAMKMVKELDDELSPIAVEHGGIAHIVARDGDEIIMVNLWQSPEASDAMARDPRVLEALQRRGMEGPPPNGRHYEVAYRMLAERATATR
jgi:hypothetical protein